MLTTELIEATHPGYHGGYLVFATENFLSSLAGMIPMLCVGPKADRKRAAAEDIGELTSELIERFKWRCIANFGLIAGVAFLCGIIIGATCAIVEFHKSHYYEEAINDV